MSDFPNTSGDVSLSPCKKAELTASKRLFQSNARYAVWAFGTAILVEILFQ